MIFLRMKYERKKREREQKEQGEGDQQDSWEKHKRAVKSRGRTKPERHMKRKAMPQARRR